MVRKKKAPVPLCLQLGYLLSTVLVPWLNLKRCDVTMFLIQLHRLMYFWSILIFIIIHQKVNSSIYWKESWNKPNAVNSIILNSVIRIDLETCDYLNSWTLQNHVLPDKTIQTYDTMLMFSDYRASIYDFCVTCRTGRCFSGTGSSSHTGSVWMWCLLNSLSAALPHFLSFWAVLTCLSVWKQL